MLECLVGLIGLDCSKGTAQSGLYLEQLPDINIGNVNKITDEGNFTVEEVFEDVEKRAILKFRTLFITEFNKCHRMYKREAIDCLICENKELLAEALWYLMGAEMLQQRLGSNRINRYTTVDRNKTKETKEYFEQEFERHLHTAVLGINLEESKCFEDENLNCRNIITFNEFTP